MSEVERHRRVQALFDALCDLDPERRSAALAAEEDRELADEVAALLEAEGSAAALDRPASEHLSDLSALTAGEGGLPDRIGEFQSSGSSERAAWGSSTRPSNARHAAGSRSS